MTLRSQRTTSNSSPLLNHSLSEDALKQQIQTAMQQCRQATLALFDAVNYSTFCCQAHPDFSPIGWHLGHIAYTESLWLLEHSAGLAPQFPHYRRLFAADTLPKTERVYLPTLSEVRCYLHSVRSAVFEYLKTAPIVEQERLWRWLLQHESQHAETVTLILALIRQASRPQEQTPPLLPERSPHVDDMVCIPAGHFDYGDDMIDALDNERPVQSGYLDTYWIDRYPVTCQQYQAFMAAGGYQERRWWSEAGWQWLQTTQVTQPLYWVDNAAFAKHPVTGVSWYEADAYARFMGKRLPTETEWEKAASWNPETNQRQRYPWGNSEPQEQRCNYGHLNGQTTEVDRYPAGKSPYGCYDLLGNVWEWTASWFNGYDGFVAYPYRGYSQAYFDNQHKVLKGGSWATYPWAMRSAFRNWYHPHVREIFAGFRCAADAPAPAGNQ